MVGVEVTNCRGIALLNIFLYRPTLKGFIAHTYGCSPTPIIFFKTNLHVKWFSLYCGYFFFRGTGRVTAPNVKKSIIVLRFCFMRRGGRICKTVVGNLKQGGGRSHLFSLQRRPCPKLLPLQRYPFLLIFLHNTQV